MIINICYQIYIFLIVWLLINILIRSIWFLYVEEENHGRNADLITKHFIAEGVVCDHSILIVDVERKPEAIVNIFYSVVDYE